jgi:hypothetical protein
MSSIHTQLEDKFVASSCIYSLPDLPYFSVQTTAPFAYTEKQAEILFS